VTAVLTAAFFAVPLVLLAVPLVLLAVPLVLLAVANPFVDPGFGLRVFGSFRF